MIDLHAHYLPEMDDGAKNAAESLEMLKNSFLQGVSVCVATPHSVIHCEEDIEEFIKKERLLIKGLLMQQRQRTVKSRS